MTVFLAPLLQLIIIMYFIIDLMVLGTLLVACLALKTARTFGELKMQRKEMRAQLSITRPLSGRHNKIWRQQKRWELVDRRSAIRRRKGGE